ncbi:MAG: FtsL-like putative cell division protein [Bacteroidota bacterium]
MAENTYKKPETQASGQEQKKGGGFLQSMLNGSFLTFERSPGLLPFLLFLAALAVLFIANTYYAEKKIRQIEGLRHEVTELRTIYISNKAELMYLSNQSEMAKRLTHKGIFESTVPPKIVSEAKQKRHFFLRIFNPVK